MEQGYMENNVLNILEQAKEMFQDRNKKYGSVDEMFEAMAKRMALSSHTNVTPYQACQAMIDTKQARLDLHPSDDSFVDAIVYMAISYYLWNKQKKNGKKMQDFSKILDTPPSEYLKQSQQ